MEDKILSLLNRPNYTPQNVAELRAQLGFRQSQQRELEHVLARLERTGQIARIKQGNRYALPLAADLVPGRIRMNRAGVGFLQADDPKVPTIRVAQDATSTAMHGDHVLVRRDVLPHIPRRNERDEATGRVVRVLERARTQLVGTLRKGRQFLYVIPDDPRITHDICVTPPRDTGRPAQDGDKVVVELREWVSRHANPEGEIIEVLGPPDAEGVDMLSVIRQYKLALHFPEVRLDVSFTDETDDVFMEIIAVLGDLLPLRDFQNFRIIMQKAKTTGGAGIDDVISRIDIIGQRGGVLLSKEAGQGEVSIAERRQTAAPLRRQDNVDIK